MLGIKRFAAALGLAAFAAVTAAPLTAAVAQAQQLVQGYAEGDRAVIGTRWRATRSTSLLPQPFDNQTPIRSVRSGNTMQSVGAFRGTATGIYLQVRYRGSIGWVDERDIRSASATGQVQRPIIQTTAGIRHRIVNVNNWASLRQGPGAQTSRLARVPRGAIVTTAGESTERGNQGWTAVFYQGTRGWMPDRFLRQANDGGGSAGNDTGNGGAQAPANTQPTQAGVVYSITNVNNWASLRGLPSTQSVRLAKVPRGARVTTTGDKTFAGGLTWLSVDYNGQRGFMPTKFLRRGGGSSAGNGNGGGTNVGNGGGSGNSGAYPVGTYRIVNVNNWASLRSRTSRSAGRVAKVPRGQNIYHNGDRARSGGELWLRVNWNGVNGWMPVEYLRLN